MNEKHRISFTGLASLSRIRTDPCDDFEFIISGNKYRSNRFVATFISPEIAKKQEADSSFSSYEIKLKDGGESKIAKDFEKLIKGQEIYVDSTNWKDIYELGVVLGNTDIVGAAQLASTAEEEFSPDNITEIIRHKQEYNCPLEKEITYIAQNFALIPFNTLMKIDPSIIECAISSPKLVIDSEDSLLDFLVDLYVKSSQLAPIFQHVAFDHVSSNMMQKFISLVHFEDLTPEVWRAVSRRLVLSVRPKMKYIDRYIKQKEEVEEVDGERIEYKGEPFRGIFRSLSEKCGGNPAKENLVEFKISSRGRLQPYVMLDYSSKQWFFTGNIPNSWFAVDLKARAVSVTCYSVQTDGNGSSHPIAWVLEGSNSLDAADVDWAVIDNRSDPAMDSDFKIGTYQCRPSRFFRCFRFRMPDKNASGNNFFGFTCFEIFGVVRDYSS